MKEYIEKALIELNKKSLKVIQTETALTWCGRACAAKIMGLDSDAREYAHEAIEHAGLSGDINFISDILKVISNHKIEI